jgi:two-component system sensor histidine kinase/response regulator
MYFAISSRLNFIFLNYSKTQNFEFVKLTNSDTLFVKINQLVLIYAIGFTLFNFFNEYFSASLINAVQSGISLINIFLFKRGFKNAAKFSLSFCSIIIVFLYHIGFVADTIAYFYYLPIIVLSIAFFQDQGKLFRYLIILASMMATVSLLLFRIKWNAIILGESELIVIKLLNVAGPLFITISILIYYHKLSLSLIDELNEKSEKLSELVSMLDHQIQNKNRLFALISHDLRSPLSTISNGLRLLQDGRVNASEADSLINGLRFRTSQTIELLNDLFLWINMDKNTLNFKPEAININHILIKVKEFSTIMTHDKKMEIIVEYADNPICMADKNMIEAVIRNLVSNAIKFSERESKILLKAISDNEQCRIEVQDHGVGMSNEILEKLTMNERVVANGTNDETGYGFGLKLCKDFLHAHNTLLEIESELGLGTKVGFWLNMQNELS